VHIPRLTCPRCDRELQNAELREVAVRLCATCKGALVTQLKLTPLLEALSTDILRSLDPDARLEPVKDQGRRIPCPTCRQRMDNDDYCAAGLVRFDRCNRCQLLWLDSGTLGAMTMMWARMNSRLARDRAIIAQGIPSVIVVQPFSLGITVWDVLGATLIPM